MKRTLWIALGLVAVATAAAALLQGEPSNAEADMEVPFRAAETALDDVQVRHEFVTIATPLPPPAATSRSVTPRQPARRTSPGAGPLSKTARALVGDGRHRPEPFPRVK
jgi:Tfp pilus assembly protein PilX